MCEFLCVCMGGIKRVNLYIRRSVVDKHMKITK